MIEQKQVAEVGSYVTGKLKGVEDCRQGVLTVVKKNGTSIVMGELGRYICEGDLVGVPDKNIFLPETKAHLLKVRRQLGLIR
jgi:hypothetical protein